MVLVQTSHKCFSRLNFAGAIGGDFMVDDHQKEKSDSTDRQADDSCKSEMAASNCCYVIDPCSYYIVNSRGCFVDPCCC